jgi:hypothetical protein
LAENVFPQPMLVVVLVVVKVVVVLGVWHRRGTYPTLRLRGNREISSHILK